MKKLFLITLIPFMGISQTDIYSENFESLTTASSGGWTLGSAGIGANNIWAITTGGAGVQSPITGTKSLRVMRYNGTFNYNPNNSTDIQARKQIVASGYTALTLQFSYKCNGEWGFDMYDYGRVGYSTDGTTVTWFTDGGLWDDGYFTDATSTETQTYNLPSTLDNSTFYIHFQWVNDNSVAGQPGFIIDDVVVSGESVNTLPVELISFTGQPEVAGNNLKWITSSEKDNDYFTIERSPDGIEWERISTIPGAGTSNIETDYEYTDNSFTSDLNYYRLSQTDYNGITTEKGIIAIQRTPEETPLKYINILGQEVPESEAVFTVYQSGKVERLKIYFDK